METPGSGGFGLRTVTDIQVLFLCSLEQKLK